MCKKVLCFVVVIGLAFSLSACKAKQANDSSSKTTGYVSQTSELSSSGDTSGNAASNSTSVGPKTSSGKTSSGGTVSRRVVSNAPEQVMTNTVTISGDKVIQTLILNGNTQVFTFTFTAGKVTACHYTATLRTEAEAEMQLANFEGSNSAVKLYNNLAVNGKVVTADYTKARLNEYLSYNQAGLKIYLQNLTY